MERHRLETDALCWGKARFAGLVYPQPSALADGDL